MALYGDPYRALDAEMSHITLSETRIERRVLIIKQMKEEQGVTEQLKADNKMLWVGKVTNICTCADELIKNKLSYD